MTHNFVKIEHISMSMKISLPAGGDYYHCSRCEMIVYRKSEDYVISGWNNIFNMRYHRMLALEISCNEWVIREIIE